MPANNAPNSLTHLLTNQRQVTVQAAHTARVDEDGAVIDDDPEETAAFILASAERARGRG